jgi:hypothetical protein
MTAGRLLSVLAAVVIVAGLVVSACRPARTPVNNPIELKPISRDCVDVVAVNGGSRYVRSICLASPTGGVRPLSVSLDEQVRCLRVSEQGGRHLAYVGVGDKPNRDRIEIEPVGGTATFGLRNRDVHIVHPDGGGPPKIELSTGRIGIEAFIDPCWKICSTLKGDLVVEVGGGDESVAYAPPTQPPCAILGPKAFGGGKDGGSGEQGRGSQSRTLDAGAGSKRKE